jgi:hypothetical protein
MTLTHRSDSKLFSLLHSLTHRFTPSFHSQSATTEARLSKLEMTVSKQ